MLLGLNCKLYHDPLPPWGFEFLLWVNCQAWWQYTRYGSDARYEAQDRNTQADDASWSDEASVGERPDCHVSEEEQEVPDARDVFSEDCEESVSGSAEPRLFPDSIDQYQQGRSAGDQPRCEFCCTCKSTVIGALQCSCIREEDETMGRLPAFDWEEDDLGQYFGDLV